MVSRRINGFGLGGFAPEDYICRACRGDPWISIPDGKGLMAADFNLFSVESCLQYDCILIVSETHMIT